MTDQHEPSGTLQIRTIPMPADTNGAGDIFGGWVMSQMDLAASIPAVERSGRRVATVAVNAMHFVEPVQIGDIVCVYTDVVRIGRTSITIHVETWVRRKFICEHIKVTEADFTFVALDDAGRPTPIDQKAETS